MAAKKTLSEVINELTTDTYIRERIIENAAQGVYRMLATGEDRLRGMAHDLKAEMAKASPSRIRIEKLTEAVGRVAVGCEETRRVANHLAEQYNAVTGKTLAAPPSAEEREANKASVLEAATKALKAAHAA